MPLTHCVEGLHTQRAVSTADRYETSSPTQKRRQAPPSIGIRNHHIHRKSCSASVGVVLAFPDVVRRVGDSQKRGPKTERLVDTAGDHPNVATAGFEHLREPRDATSERLPSQTIAAPVWRSKKCSRLVSTASTTRSPSRRDVPAGRRATKAAPDAAAIPPSADVVSAPCLQRSR